MAKLSVNAIWVKYVKPLNVPFKDWYAKELCDYESKERKKEFDVWLNNKYTLNGVQSWHSLNGRTTITLSTPLNIPQIPQNDLKTINLALGQTKVEKPIVKEEVKVEVIPTLDKKPLGMPPLLTWGLILGVAAGLTYVGIRIFEKNKNKE